MDTVYTAYIHTLNSNAQYIELKSCILLYMEIVICISTRICLNGHAWQEILDICLLNQSSFPEILAINQSRSQSI